MGSVFHDSTETWKSWNIYITDSNPIYRQQKIPWQVEQVLAMLPVSVYTPQPSRPNWMLLWERTATYFIQVLTSVPHISTNYLNGSPAGQCSKLVKCCFATAWISKFDTESWAWCTFLIIDLPVASPSLQQAQCFTKENSQIGSFPISDTYHLTVWWSENLCTKFWGIRRTRRSHLPCGRAASQPYHNTPSLKSMAFPYCEGERKICNSTRRLQDWT